ncbi:DUF1134 domain-containing protein [Sphingomonas sp.]|jgi:hypothetical protein|uniref:DUF1134 domain-containing protein n=1 Tax=Sphingomonas sp. TaxID=28214 RepID=UPI002DEA1C56|nr:DUF1134 domain-containing protein [Sphingomonas sp.]
MGRKVGAWVLAAAAVAAPAIAQVQAVDPNMVIDADLGPAPAVPAQPGQDQGVYYGDTAPAPAPSPMAPADPAPATAATAAAAPAGTYKKDDLIGAAEGVFGKGAKGLAQLIEKILKDQGEPSGYITGREAGGAFVVGLRYGSGTLTHKVEGQRPVYWTGPSVGFDAGGNAGSTFVLVYNLHDSHELYQRFPAGEGNAYFVGGLTASYMRSGDVVLIPIRMGAGLRLGANVGYMKFSQKQNWLPF